MANCSVVIPYYQREPGILLRALKSVFAQSYRDFHIVVVDDASPVSADEDLAALSLEERASITVIKQPNGGPGAARNTGLDHIAEGTRFAAFLDSDDEWTPDHLKNAVEGMSLFDADCYWASITGGEDFYYHFGMSALAETTVVNRLSETPAYMEVPDPAVMLKNWSFMHLSCMVIGEPLFRKIRLEAALRLAAEDVLFFYDCARCKTRDPMRLRWSDAWRRGDDIAGDQQLQMERLGRDGRGRLSPKANSGVVTQRSHAQGCPLLGRALRERMESRGGSKQAWRRRKPRDDQSRTPPIRRPFDGQAGPGVAGASLGLQGGTSTEFGCGSREPQEASPRDHRRSAPGLFLTDNRRPKQIAKPLGIFRPRPARPECCDLVGNDAGDNRR
jgi:Glycosyl transferase family 2